MKKILSFLYCTASIPQYIGKNHALYSLLRKLWVLECAQLDAHKYLSVELIVFKEPPVTGKRRKNQSSFPLLLSAWNKFSKQILYVPFHEWEIVWIANP